MPELNDRWKTWIWQNVGRGCEKDHLFKVLLDRGFSYEAIHQELGHEPTQPLEDLEVEVVSGSPALGLPTQTIERRLLGPNLWDLPGVLSPSDCDVLIEAARPYLKPSTIVYDSGKSGEEGEKASEDRTSFGISLDFRAPSAEYVSILDHLRRTISELTNLPESHQEVFQILRYQPGQKFEDHHDAFSPGSEYLRGENNRGGQRVFSFMVYLADAEKGGETVFPLLEATVAASCGRGIFWPNVTTDGRIHAESLHTSVPVERGEKWVLVCWIREGPFGFPIEHRGISDLRGIETWIGPSVKRDRPVWIEEQAEEQILEVPYLDAGGPESRGFEKSALDRSLYEEVLGIYRSIESELILEEGDAIGTFLGTVRGDLPPALFFEVPALNALVHEFLRPVHEEWCRFELTPSTCYGFRVYLPGAYLHNHVDRPHTHVISSTICVASDLYSSWGLHALDADGKSHRVDLEPGQMLLYESARTLHGRPVPLHGRYYAGLFVHYQPAVDHELWVRSPKAWLEAHPIP